VKYYLVAGERSGDLHGGNLVKSLLHYDSNAILRGFGGDEMQAAGVDLAVHYREMAFMGFVSLISSLNKIFKYIAICKSDIVAFNPDAIILIDYGGFNLKIAAFAKSKGYIVYYYIPPKVWAWNQKRAWKLKKYVDRLFIILPFEKDFYKKYDLQVDYVGNPVLDAIRAFRPDREFISRLKLAGERKLVALLPGSRKVELKRIVPLMAKIAMTNKDVQFIVASVSNLPASLYQPLQGITNVKFVEGETYDLLTHADAAIVTSGTATLETALFKVPQLVLYKTNIVEYMIARTLIQVPYISLVNLIAEKPVVRELIQHEANGNTIQNELQKLLYDQNYVANMSGNYDRIFELLNTGSASENTAKMIANYLSQAKA